MNRSRVLLFPALFLLIACETQAPAPFTNYGVGAGEGSAGVHTVAAGETLWTISKRYRMEMRDIALLNRLAPPFDLPPGTRLRLPPPLEYKVRPGDTLYQVSRLFNASTTDIARLNHLNAPYALQTGNVLRMPAPHAPPAEAPMMMASVAPEPVVQVPLVVAEVAPPPPVYDRGPHILQAPPSTPITSERLAPPPQQKPQQQRIASVQPQVLRSPGRMAPPSVPHQPVAPPSPIQPVSYHPHETVRAVKQKITAETPKRASSKFLRPVHGRTLSGYGPKPDGLHNDGINIRAPRGTPVEAAENGVVVYAGNELKGSGNLILIRHEGRWMTAYAHLDHMNIKRGDVVKRGQNIGTVGDTGSVKEPQLHFEVRRGTEAINPERFLEG